jgi:hypothetical protein
MLRPIDQILGRKRIKISLLLKRQRSRRENPILIIPDHSLRISISARKNRITGILLLTRASAAE